MLRLPEVEYASPESIDEAIKILSSRDKLTMPIAGGTDTIPKIKRRQIQPDTLVDLKGISDLHGIHQTNYGIQIGALTSLSTVADNPEVKDACPAVAQAAGMVGSPSHQRMGTIGGNICQDTRCNYYDQSKDWRESLGWCKKAPNTEGYNPEDTNSDVPCRTAPGSGRCWAIFASDCAPALIAHQAQVTIVSPDGKRKLPLNELYTDDGMRPVEKEQTEIITKIDIPDIESESGYRKLRQRDSFDFPSLGVAIAINQDGEIIQNVNIVLGAVSTRPIVVTEANEILEGKPPSKERIEKAADIAKGEARPMDNDDISPAYRNRMTSVYTRRILTDLIEGDFSGFGSD